MQKALELSDRHQPSPLMKAILTTDGSFTILLEALSGQKVVIETIDQYITNDHEQHVRLDLRSDEDVISRQVLLKGDQDGTVLTYAQSHIVPSRLSDGLRDDLLAGREPIGKLLRAYKLPQFREFRDWHYDEISPSIERYLGSGHAYIRDYTVHSPSIAGCSQPIMTICEFFRPDIGGIIAT